MKPPSEKLELIIPVTIPSLFGKYDQAMFIATAIVSPFAIPKVTEKNIRKPQ